MDTMNAMTVQSAIRTQLMQEGPCTLENLLTRLSQFSWSEIFSVVDQLSREGTLVLRRPARFGYEVSIGAGRLLPEEAQPSAVSERASRTNPENQI
jgi:hypothetical protein